MSDSIPQLLFPRLDVTGPSRLGDYATGERILFQVKPFPELAGPERVLIIQRGGRLE